MMLTSNNDPVSDVGEIISVPETSSVVAFVQNPMLDTLKTQSEGYAEGHSQLETISEPNFVDSTVNISNSRVMSAFLILNSMIGSGIFNQPYVFSRSGLGSAILLITVTAAFVYLGIVALIEASIHTSTDDFSAVGRACFGRAGELAVDISIIISSVGSIMSYIAVIGHLASTLLGSWGWSYANNDGVYLITSIMIFAFVMPLCAHRYFGHFAFISVLSMGSVCCVLLLIVIVGPIITAGTHRVERLFIQNGALGQLGSIIFALNCAPSVLPTYKYIKKEHKNSKGWRQIAFASTLAGYIGILLMGISGYLMFGDNTEEIIIMNFTGHYADVFKILLIVHLILYTPLDFLVLRQSVLRVIGVKSGLLLSQKLNIITTVVILGGILALVLLLRSVGLSSGATFGAVLGLTGGISGMYGVILTVIMYRYNEQLVMYTYSVLTSFILPGIFYVICMPKKAPLKLACLCMVFGGIVTLIMVPYAVTSELTSIE